MTKVNCLRASYFRAGLAGAGLLILSTLSPQAEACGGLFCSSANPVNQAAERIVFSKNANGTITTIVQIDYAGPAEKFAWVLPIPGVPEVDVSSTQALDRLQLATNPSYQLTNTFADDCAFFAGGGGAVASGGGANGTGGGVAAIPAPVVTVLKDGSVGPYDYEVISVEVEDEDPAQVAIDWMEDNGYDIDSLGADVLRPYLVNGMNLVAVRLTKDAMVGSIRPLSLTYESVIPVIPIRPTAVAANDDMGILVWVLGEHRAVPTNYKGLELNELMIDWFNPNSTYNQVVTLAADEAEGQGFVTEFSGSGTDSLRPIVLYSETDEQQWELIEGESDLWLALDRSITSFGTFDGFVEAAGAHINLRNGVSVEEFIECSACYFNGYDSLEELSASGRTTPLIPPSGDREVEGLIGEDDPIFDTDLSAFKAELDLLVLAPLRRVDALVEDAAKITRLYTTLSADEMTMDPSFDFNPDLEDYSNIHTLNRVMQCGNSEWEATFEDGQVVTGSGSVWPFSPGDVSLDFPAAAQIFQFSTSGQGELIVDNRSKMDEMTAGDEMDRTMSSQGGSGNSSGSSGGSKAEESEGEPSDEEEMGVSATDGNGKQEDRGEMKIVDSPGCSLLQGQTRTGPFGIWGAVALLGSLFLRRRVVSTGATRI